MVDLIISPAIVFSNGWMSRFPYAGSPPLPSAPTIANRPEGFSQGFDILNPAFGAFYFIGVFNGGSLFPSPRFVTSTQMDCDNS